MLGAASMGRAQEGVFVNAASGNLVINRVDEMLIGRGPDSIFSRTYNSQGVWDGDNNDNWRMGAYRRVHDLTGGQDAPGSTVKRTDWDGSEATYSWSAAQSAYVSTDGAGAYDTLTFASGVWTWKDGDSRVTELYDAANGGRITSTADTDGNALTYSYNVAGRLTEVRTADDSYTTLVYDGDRLTDLTTSYRETAGGPLKTLTRVHYGYETTGARRLIRVEVDLTPTDGGDSQIYWTNYSYETGSNRIATISQKDASLISITYDASGRVLTLTQDETASISRLTSFAYGSGQTTVTDPSGQETVLTYETSGPNAGQLKTIVSPPPVTGGSVQTTTFTYNLKGDLISVTEPSGRFVVYDDQPDVVEASAGYDGNGNRRLERDKAGNTIVRTFGLNNELLTETRFATPDSDGSGAATPSGGLTTRYVYDRDEDNGNATEVHLRFVISPEGQVTEFCYNAAGQTTSVIQYAGNPYDVSGLAENASPSEKAMTTWLATLSDKSGARRTDTTYNFRGQIESVTSYGRTEPDGDGDLTTASERTRTFYVYDQAGNLLKRQVEGSQTAETYQYDGLNRLIYSHDYRGLVATVIFDDAALTTTMEIGGELIRTSVFNRAGELLSFAESASGISTATTSYRYDPMGRLRVKTDPAANSIYYLYDAVGRVVGEVDADGSLIEFAYDTDGRVIRTVRYSNRVDAGDLDALDSNAGSFDIELSDIRPDAASADIWEWRLYDNAGRLAVTVDGSGAVVAYAYDGLSRLVGTTEYATRLSAETVTAFKTIPPSLTPPSGPAPAPTTPPSGPGYNSLTGTDTNNTLTGGAGSDVIQGLGGNDILSGGDGADWIHGGDAQDTLNGNNGDDILIGGGGVDQLFGGSGTSSGADIFVLRPGDGADVIRDFGLTQNDRIDISAYGVYTNISQLNLSQSGANTLLVLTSGGVDVTITINGVAFGNLTNDDFIFAQPPSVFPAADAANDRVTRNFYDKDSRLVATVDPEGYVTRLVYDHAGQLVETISYADAGNPAAATLTALMSSIAVDPDKDIHNWSFHDRRGLLLASVDGEGHVVRYQYSALGHLIEQVRGQRLTPSQLNVLLAIDPDAAVRPTMGDVPAAASGTVLETTSWTRDQYGVVLSETRILAAGTETDVYRYDSRGRLQSVTTAYGGVDARTTAYRYDARGRLTGQISGQGAALLGAYGTWQADTVLVGTASAETLTGTAGRDLIQGLNGNDILYGLDGDDRLEGGGNVDEMHGGDGDDVIVSGTGNDLILEGGAGRDTFVFQALDGVETIIDFEVGVDLIDLRAVGGYQSIALSGTLDSLITLAGGGTIKVKNVLPAQLTAASFRNGSYSQVVVGTSGVDSLLAAARADGGAGNELILGLANNDTLEGGAGNDRLDGGAGADVIIGGDGDDIILAGTSNDTSLTGGAGRDIFVFLPGDGVDVIMDFQVGIDVIDLTAFDGYPSIAVSSATDTLITFTGGGSVRLKNVLPAQLTGGHLLLSTDAIFRNHGVTYSYDAADRLISETQPDGTGSGVHTSVYYYDADNRLDFAINALGEVVEHRYDAFGRRTDAITYATRLSTAGLTGGSVTPALTTAVEAIANPILDSHLKTAFNLAGTVATMTDAEGAVTSFAYNAFGEMIGRADPLGLAAPGTDMTRQTAYAYDRRGQLTSTTFDPAGLQITTASVYDAFGRVINTTDPDGKVRHTSYDQAGRVVVLTDALGNDTVFGYDDRGHTVSIEDRLHGVTTFTYDLGGRVVTMKTAEDLVTTTTYNAYGQEISITDGGGRTVTYAYDRDGKLLSATDGLGQQVRNVYDTAGRLSATFDARGSKTGFTYDAANRLLTQTRDVGGLNLSTTYEYDAKGEQTRIVEGGRTTLIGFDRNGRTTSVIVDPTGLGLTTLYKYDMAGRQVRVSEGQTPPAGTFVAGRITDYSYDKADRLVKTLVDPGGLALKTEYAYDKRGNVVASLDANGAITRFIYDDDNRLTYTVDGAGGVSRTIYDDEGRVLTTIGYATAVSTAGMPGWPNAKITSISVTTAANDRINHYVYDADGRLAYEIDALNYVRGYHYDGSGNLVRTQAFDTAISPTASHAKGDLDDLIDSLDLAEDPRTRTSTAIYDAVGRRTYAIDAAGAVTAFNYDANGNLTEQLQFAALYDAGAAPNFAAWVSSNAATARSTRAIYDGADRQVFSIDALGRVTQVTHNALGQVVTVRAFDAVYGSGLPSLSAMQNWADAHNSDTLDRVSQSRYDTAGRLLFTLDALGYVVEFVLDPLGAVTSRIEHADPCTVATATTLVAGDPASSARITSYAYDAAGRLYETTDAAGYKTRLSLDGLGQATTIKAAYGTADEAVTTRTYDGAGRLKTETRGVGTAQAAKTAYSYDGLGQVTQIRVAADTDDEAVTTISYTSRGQVDSQTRAPGQAEQSVTAYVYDAFGDQLSMTTGDMRSERDYDLVGRVVTTRTALRTEGGETVWATTVSKYDAFGNVVEVTDPRGSVGYFYYDAADRLTLQVDPEGYATSTSYTLDAGKEVTTVTRHAARTSGTPAIGAPPTVNTATADALTTVVRDKLGRVVSTTDAETYTESYGLNAFGDRITVTNRLGGVTTNTYDKRGLLTQEVIAVTWKNAAGADQTQTIQNEYSYDGRRNRTQSIEAATSSVARTFTYTYDKLDRLTGQLGETVSIVDAATLATTSATPTQSLRYDLRGNLIETVDAAGARIQYWYDDLDRKIRQVDALGQLTVWEYDDRNNATRMVKYDTAISLPTSGDRTLPQPAAGDTFRDTRYAYDRNNRLTETKVLGVRTGSWAGSVYSTTVTDIVTKQTYDAAGNVTVETDGRGNSVFHYFDRLGREIAKVDQEGYLTTWARDAEGNVTSERRYANPVASTVTAVDLENLTVTVRGLTEASTAGLTSLTGGLAHTDDRVTTFTYDRNGRRLTETRWGVAAWSVNATTGALSAIDGDPLTSGYQVPNAQITYSYNRLGQVLSKTEANGDLTSYLYDTLGRQVWMKGASVVDFDNPSVNVRTTTEYAYDGLGNLFSTRQGKEAANASTDRVTLYGYDAAGRLTSTTTALTSTVNFTRTYGYDIAGRVVMDSYNRLKSDGSTEHEAQVYSYDLMGHVVQQTTAVENQTTHVWTFGDRSHLRYNTHGEVTGKGVTAGDTTTATYQESYAYDAGGRLWRSNAGDGAVKLFLHDAAGNVTATITSDGANLGAYATQADAVSALTSGGSLGSADLGDVNLTFGVFDKRGQQRGTREPFRELRQVAGSPSTLTTATITRARSFNAFGEVVAETDGNGNTTTFTYNAMGRLIRKQSPLVSYTRENGSTVSIRPTEDYYHDLSGRLVGTRDANNTLDSTGAALDAHDTIAGGDRLNTRILLAGTGHGDGDALTTVEFRADGSKATTEYDVYGNARKLTNPLLNVETRTYDRAGRLTAQTRPSGQIWSVTLNDEEDNFIGAPTSTTGSLVESYAYDGLGQMIRHWNSTSAAVEKTDYDSQGRVISFVDYGAHATTYSYAFNAAIGDGDLGVGGGWVKTTVNAAALTSTEKLDYFGHTVWRSDFGGHEFTFDFDRAARLVKQTTAQPGGPWPAGYIGTIDYTYYNTGLGRTIYEQLIHPDEGEADTTWRSDRKLTTLGYDAQGNRVFERYETSYAGVRWIPPKPVNEDPEHPPGDDDEIPEEMEPGYYEPFGDMKVYQNTEVTYDALNRMTSLDDSRPMDDFATGVDGDPVDTTDDMALSIDYEYDANGNIRRVDTHYRDVDAATATGHKDQWYRYDSMNRMVMAKGEMAGGTIVRGTYGVEMAYDAAGQRVQQTTTNADLSEHREQYVYTASGFLEQVLMADGAASYTQRVLERHDAMGRVVYHEEWRLDPIVGLKTVYVRKAVYNALSQVQSDQTFSLHDNDFFYRTGNVYAYGAYNATSGNYDGQYQGGGATYIEGRTYKLETNPEYKYTTETVNKYTWWEGARQSLITTTPDNDDPYLRSSSGTMYDFNGRLRDWRIEDINARQIDYTVNANGQVMERNEVSLDEDTPAGARPRQLFYFFNGMQVGDIGNKGAMDVDYAETIRRRTAEADDGFFPWGQAAASDFGNTYNPINSQTAGATGYSYTVNTGDTLQSIAVALWGDANLWYLIAEANGLNGSEPLVAGRTLSIPNKVVNVHNSSSTFRVYDPNEGLGDIMPGQPKPPVGDEGCGKAAMIIMVIVAIVVTVVTFGAALAAIVPAAAGTFATMGTVLVGGVTLAEAGFLAAAGAMAGAAGSLASQFAGMVMHVQDDISWSAVALSALTGAVSAASGGLLGNIPWLSGTGPLATAGRAAGSAAISQGVAVASGLQRQFDWTSVAVAGVSAGVGAWVANGIQSAAVRNAVAGSSGGILEAHAAGAHAMNGPWGLGGTANQPISDMAAALAGAATQSLIDGSDFGDNAMDAMPSVIVATIGNMVARGAGKRPAGQPVGGTENPNGDASDRIQLEQSQDTAGLIVDPGDSLSLFLADRSYEPLTDLDSENGGIAASRLLSDPLGGNSGGSEQPPEWWADYRYVGPQGDDFHVQKNRPVLYGGYPVSGGLLNGKPTYFVTGQHPEILGLVDYLSDTPDFDLVTDLSEVRIEGGPIRGRQLREADEQYQFSRSLVGDIVRRDSWRLGATPQVKMTPEFRRMLTSPPSGSPQSRGATNPTDLERWDNARLARNKLAIEKMQSGARGDNFTDNAFLQEIMVAPIWDDFVNLTTFAGGAWDYLYSPYGAYIDMRYGQPLEQMTGGAVSSTFLGDGANLGLQFVVGSKLTPTASGARANFVVDDLVAAERGEFIGPVIGRSGFKNFDELSEAVGVRYQTYVDDAYAAAMQAEARGALRGNPNTRVGDFVDRESARRLKGWLEYEGLPETRTGLVQINRWLRDPTPGSSLYVRPDVRIPRAGAIYDATVGFKPHNSTQLTSFDQFSGGDRITVVRPGAVGGSYSRIP